MPVTLWPMQPFRKTSELNFTKLAFKILGTKLSLCSYLENDNFLRRDFDDIASVQIPWRSRKHHINCSF